VNVTFRPLEPNAFTTPSGWRRPFNSTYAQTLAVLDREIPLMAGLVVICLATAAAYVAGYRTGIYEGRVEGRADGRLDGFEQGHWIGETKGYAAGYDRGLLDASPAVVPGGEGGGDA